MDFLPFPKLPRMARSCLITEKIDGTNGQVAIEPLLHPEFADDPNAGWVAVRPIDGVPHCIFAGSRTRWLRPEGYGPKGCDNFAFGAWVRDNADELIKLGPGRHYGEWWGKGIQRGYGMSSRYFSLFNAERWQSQSAHTSFPSCCSVVPVLYRGVFDTIIADNAVEALRTWGSRAAPGFDKPEGIVVFHKASNSLFKKTLEKDDEPKHQSRDQDGNAQAPKEQRRKAFDVVQ